MTRRISGYWFPLFAAWLLFGLMVQPANAGGGPENVLLVVSADSETSRMVANWYQRLRRIPDSNVLYLREIPTKHVMDWKDAESKILRPVLEAIQQRKLTMQIDYVVYSTGFPTQIAIDDHRRAFLEQYEKETGQEPPARLQQVFQGRASLTSLTFAIAQALRGDASYMGLNSNHYYRKPVAEMMLNPFVGPAQEKYSEAVKAVRENRGADAIELLKTLAATHPAQCVVHFRMAQAWAIEGDARKCAEELAAASRTGWCYRKFTRSDVAIGRMFDNPLVRGVVDRLPDEEYEFAPTMGCSSRLFWGPGGTINGTPDQGLAYLMSTMLGTNWQNGNTEAEIVDYLKASVGADFTAPQGEFCFADTADVRTKTRKPNFQDAIERLEAMGHKTSISAATLPPQKMVAGGMIGTSSFSWRGSGSTILPGAIVDNLTSHGGNFVAASQTKLTELLRNGAAGSSGTVVEPFSIQAKFPHPMIQVHYASGCSLAESFYQSVAGPFQLLIVGDALCQPWAKPPRFTTKGLQMGETVKGDIRIEVVPDENGPGISATEVFLDGRFVAMQQGTPDVTFNSEDLSDGYHELRLVCRDNTPVQTRAGTIIRFLVNNRGQKVILSSTTTKVSVEGNLQLTVESGLDGEIEITHNGEVIGTARSPGGKVTVQALRIGRGPAEIVAVSKDEKGRLVSSVPLAVDIEGELATETSSTR